MYSFMGRRLSQNTMHKIRHFFIIPIYISDLRYIYPTSDIYIRPPICISDLRYVYPTSDMISDFRYVYPTSDMISDFRYDIRLPICISDFRYDMRLPLYTSDFRYDIRPLICILNISHCIGSIDIISIPP